jgi:hypothetical protein
MRFTSGIISLLFGVDIRSSSAFKLGKLAFELQVDLSLLFSGKCHFNTP